MRTSKQLLIYVLVFLCSAAFLLYKNRRELNDLAFLGGDTWNYQALGVNLAFGHGYQEGGIEPFVKYRFEDAPQKNRQGVTSEAEKIRYSTYREQFLKGGQFTFFRAPGYPVFLAIVYSLLGVHPLAVKILQLVLTSLCCSLLVWIGAYYWQKPGLITGTAAAAVYLYYFCPSPTTIMTESLILCGLMLWALYFIFAEQRPSSRASLILGAISTILILIKGSNLFIPLFYIVYRGFVVRKLRAVLLSTAYFCLPIFVVIGSWSTYATARLGRFVFISTDGDSLILDSNNEDSLKDGDWHPEWRTTHAGDPFYLYNRSRVAGFSTLQKLGIFINQNKKQLPGFLLKKVLNTFSFTRKSVALTLVLLLAYFVTASLRRTQEKLLVFPIIFLCNLLLITVIFYGKFRFAQPFYAFFVLPAMYLVTLPFLRTHSSSS